MKQVFFLVFFLISDVFLVLAQQDTARYIFMGHTRDDDREHEYLLKTVELIDYSKYDLILLGGDLTWNTSAERNTLQYCDSVFNLGDANTHLAAGNHDLDNISDLLEFTGKSRYYAFSKNNITFLILDTEVSVPDFKGEQLEMIRNVTDTIEKSDYLVLIHHRIIWMIGVPELAYLLDSVAASTKNLSRSDFYTDVYPLLRKVKNKGTQVLCLAGDRTDVNIRYMPEDSITFLASGMRGTVSDEDNFAIILTHVIQTGRMDWNFVALSEIDTVRAEPVETDLYDDTASGELIVYPNPSTGKFLIFLAGEKKGDIFAEVLDMSGNSILETTFSGQDNTFEINLSSFAQGVYFLRLTNNQETVIKRLVKI
jgi:hypothetical protein